MVKKKRTAGEKKMAMEEEQECKLLERKREQPAVDEDQNQSHTIIHLLQIFLK